MKKSKKTKAISFKRFYDFVNHEALLKDDGIRVEPATLHESMLLADEILRLRAIIRTIQNRVSEQADLVGQEMPLAAIFCTHATSL